MPAPLSRDLRERIVASFKDGRNYDEIAAFLRVGRATVSRVLRLHRETRDVAPREPARHGPVPLLEGAGLVALRAAVEERCDRTGDELADEVLERTGILVSKSTVLRALARLGYTRKKKSWGASEADDERVAALREKWERWIATVDPRRLVFVDETGSTIAMSRTYGLAPRGQTIRERVPRNRGTVTTVLGALTIEGLVGLMTVEGGTTADVFLAFLTQVLLPQLQPGMLVVLDNLAAHRDPRVRQAAEAAGVKLVFLPPYSPEFNPIELTWSKLKWWLRMAKARTLEALDTALAWAMDIIDSRDAAGWFRHCGVQVQPT